MFEKLFHKQEIKRLRAENEHLVEYNKKLSNQLRLKAIKVKALEKELLKLSKQRHRPNKSRERRKKRYEQGMCDDIVNERKS